MVLPVLKNNTCKVLEPPARFGVSAPIPQPESPPLVLPWKKTKGPAQPLPAWFAKALSIITVDQKHPAEVQKQPEKHPKPTHLWTTILSRLAAAKKAESGTAGFCGVSSCAQAGRYQSFSYLWGPFQVICIWWLLPKSGKPFLIFSDPRTIWLFPLPRSW